VIFEKITPWNPQKLLNGFLERCGIRKRLRRSGCHKIIALRLWLLHPDTPPRFAGVKPGKLLVLVFSTKIYGEMR